MSLDLLEEARAANQLAKAVDAMNAPILLSLTPAQAVVVVKQLQRASRLPDPSGLSTDAAREVADALIGAFPPAARDTLDAGWSHRTESRTA